MEENSLCCINSVLYTMTIQYADVTAIWVIVSGAVGGVLALLVITIILGCCSYIYRVKQRRSTYTV